MKTLYVTITVCFILSLPLGAQWRSANISLEGSSHSFGAVKEEEGVVEHSFSVINTGESPLIINRVSSTCGCITQDWPREPILPGSSGSVSVKFNPRGRSGQFSFPITIYSNATESGVVFTIQGNVVPRPKTPSDIYRRRIGDLGLVSTNVSFSRIYINETRVDTLKVFNFGEEPIEIHIDRVPKHLSFESIPKSIKPNEEGSIVVAFDAGKKDDWGFVVDRVRILPNKQNLPSNLVSISATIEEDFSKLSENQLELAPRISFQETEKNFGELTEGDVAEHEFVFSNTGKLDLIIRKVRAGCGCTTVAPEITVINPGQSSSIKASFRTQGFTGRQSKTVTVITNDPKNPITTLRISGNVNKK